MKAVIPAIDISYGRCIRLTQGDPQQEQVYDGDPVETAQEFVELGAKRLHIVDLDAAFGKGNNRGIIREICQKLAKSDCVIEVGGGIRAESDVKALLAMGVHRLILGTVLVNDFFGVQKWIHTFGKVFVASIDERDGVVQVAGWLKDSEIDTDNFLHQLEKLDLCSIVYTNIHNDGMLHGADVERGNEIAAKARVPVVLSGGIGSLADIDAIMKNTHENVYGTIVGKAIYEGKVDMKSIFEKYPPRSCMDW